MKQETYQFPFSDEAVEAACKWLVDVLLLSPGECIMWFQMGEDQSPQVSIMLREDLFEAVCDMIWSFAAGFDRAKEE